MSVDPKIDELLNSFIDGELTDRQRTEVQRLMANDPEVAVRLRRLEKCKMLMGSLPCAEAPGWLLEDVKGSLERRTLLGEQPAVLEERKGSRHLFIRRLSAVAAMVALVGILGAVIYNIVAPENPEGARVVVEGKTAPDTPGEGRPAEGALAAVAMRLDCTLNLRTGSFMESDAFVNRAIEDNGLSDCTTIERRPGTSVYTLACGRDELNVLLGRLQYVWHRFGSRTFSVLTEQFGEQVVVDDVGVGQISRIAAQNSHETCIAVAKDLAVLNTIAERLPGKEIMTAVDNAPPDVMPMIPKPRLTRYEGPAKRPAGRSEDRVKVNLVIVVEEGD
jgi:hypothetical protein